VTIHIHPAVQDANDFKLIAVNAEINDMRSNEVLQVAGPHIDRTTLPGVGSGHE